MTGETRELKRELQKYRMKAIEQEEFIKNQKNDTEVSQYLKTRIEDLEYELFLKNDKISRLEASIEKANENAQRTLENELKSDDKQNEYLKAKVEILETEMERRNAKEETDKMKRNILYEAIDANIEEQRYTIEHLNTKIKSLNQKTVQNCWYGIE